MVTLPSEFVATRLFGYFWNTNTRKLFSIKTSGVLREIKITNPNRWNELPSPAYRVSHRGRRTYLFVTELNKIPAGQNSIIPVEIKCNG